MADSARHESEHVGYTLAVGGRVFSAEIYRGGGGGTYPSLPSKLDEAACAVAPRHNAWGKESQDYQRALSLSQELGVPIAEIERRAAKIMADPAVRRGCAAIEAALREQGEIHEQEINRIFWAAHRGGSGADHDSSQGYGLLLLIAILALVVAGAVSGGGESSGRFHADQHDAVQQIGRGAQRVLEEWTR